jgi:uncharacterized protein involved in exopolysaccharide biosynthesis
MNQLLEMCGVLSRHKREMACCFLVIFGSVVALTIFGRRSYISEAKLLVRLGRENATLDSTAALASGPVVAVPPNRENDVNSAIEIIKSRVLLEAVVDSLGAEVILENAVLEQTASQQAGAGKMAAAAHNASDKALRYEAVRKLTRSLAVEAVKKSNIITITCEAGSVNLAQAIVAKLMELSLDYYAQMHRPQGTPQFLGEQAKRLQQQLARSGEELRELKDKTGISSPEGQRQILVTRLGRLEDELLESSANLAAGQAEARLLQGKLPTIAKDQLIGETRGIANPAADALRGQLYALQIKEPELRGRFAERHPEVVSLRQQLAVVSDKLAEEETARDQVTVGPSRTREDLHLTLLKQESIVAGLKEKVETLRKHVAHERDALQLFNRNYLMLANLQREVDLQEAYYRKYLENLEQSQIDQALRQERISNISIVQPASYEFKPVRPRVLWNLSLGLLFALVGSVVMAYVSESQFIPMLRQELTRASTSARTVTEERSGEVSRAGAGIA